MLSAPGVVELPNVEHLIEDAGEALGKWTYLARRRSSPSWRPARSSASIAPGETTVIVGGLVAGQGQISLIVADRDRLDVRGAGDLTSYALGRRLGRDFMVKHGARVKITEERLEQVEAFFERRGGMTILIGRFIGLVRAIAPFIAGASRMPLRKFLPYDVLGAGLWATTFCVLGYVFWRSFDQLTTWVSRGLFAFGLGRRADRRDRLPRPRCSATRSCASATKAWIAEQLEKPLLRPFAPCAAAGWHRIVRPRGRAPRRRRASSGTASRPGELGPRAHDAARASPPSARSRSSCSAI